MNVPQAPIDPPESNEAPYTHCAICGRPIFGGEDYYKIKDEDWCEACVSAMRAVAPYPDELDCELACDIDIDDDIFVKEF